MGDTQVLHCACGATREAPIHLSIVSCVRCGRAMAPAITQSLGPAPKRGLVAMATLISQLFGTLAFAFALAWIISLRVTAPVVIGVLVTGAVCVFAGGNAHRGSVVALMFCAGFDAALAALALLQPPEVVGFVGAPLARLSPTLIEQLQNLLFAAGALAALATIACIAALPQARRFASWRGEQILAAARVARG